MAVYKYAEGKQQDQTKQYKIIFMWTKEYQKCKLESTLLTHKMEENYMEEKQEFQLGDTFYYVIPNNDFEYWYLYKSVVRAVEKSGNSIYLKTESGNSVLQRKCGHTSAEAKEIVMKDWRKKSKEVIQKIRELEEK